MTRMLSLVVNAVFMLIMGLALTNEDPLPPQGWPVLACLGLCLLASLAAWRWARLGGLATLAGAAALGVAAAASSLATGLGTTGLVLSLAYPLPYLVLGSLCLMDAAAGRQVRS
jgi:hypothetical protein